MLIPFSSIETRSQIFASLLGRMLGIPEICFIILYDSYCTYLGIDVADNSPYSFFLVHSHLEFVFRHFRQTFIAILVLDTFVASAEVLAGSYHKVRNSYSTN